MRRVVAVAGICLVWASGLGVAAVWPRWNRAETLRAQVRETQSQLAKLEGRLNAARDAAGTGVVSRARDRVLSRDEVPAFLQDLRARAAASGAKVVSLEHVVKAAPAGAIAPLSVRGRIVAEGGFGALYDLLRLLENRRVFVAVSRAELAPVAADGRLKAVYQFEFLVVPAAAGAAEVEA